MHLQCGGFLHICQNKVRCMLNANGVLSDSTDLTVLRGSSGSNTGASFFLINITNIE